MLKKNEKAIKGFDRVNDATSKFLTSSSSYYYFLLSITAACIGFTISLTIHEKFSKPDFLIIVSLILWVFSFNYGLQSVNRINKMMLSFSFYVLGEMSKYNEVSEMYKKIVDDLGKESAKLRKSPLFYLLLGISSFIVWYVIKISFN